MVVAACRVSRTRAKVERGASRQICGVDASFRCYEKVPDNSPNLYPLEMGLIAVPNVSWLFDWLQYCTGV
eukprot:scaffold5317_cov160-Amphora_coffeaeformis.AAC.10